MKIFHKIAFASFLEDDESIIAVFRRPFLFMFTRVILWTAVSGLIGFLFWFFIPEIKGFSFWWGVALGGTFKILSVLAYWYVNAIVMTNESVLFIEWPRFFEKRNKRLDFTNLDSVAVEKKGAHSFLMNFGTLIFEKTGGGDPIEIERINTPTRVVRKIESYKEQKVDEKNFTEESALKDLLCQLVQTHVGENGQPKRAVEKALKQTVRVAETSETALSKKPFFKRKKQKFETENIEVETTFDDEGGVEIDLSDEN